MKDRTLLATMRITAKHPGWYQWFQRTKLRYVYLQYIRLVINSLCPLFHDKQTTFFWLSKKSSHLTLSFIRLTEIILPDKEINYRYKALSRHAFYSAHADSSTSNYCNTSAEYYIVVDEERRDTIKPETITSHHYSDDEMMYDYKPVSYTHL